MNELELFSKWFKNQTSFDIVYRKNNFGGRVPISEVLKKYDNNRDTYLVKYIIAKELMERNFKEEYALQTANSIMKKIRKLDENVGD